ncbi:hypothetical protein A2W14_04490 [Candidatus Gottesmanbacteria bacterium RBG_16_37_8]|uniref:Uncharacterized protein n=1 Tax=Candidatus Gottesmanbacteria bacterium RBG_16_37_8 TaxID=1798371 RepID=A0A1F5YSD1_9BACT|nr:MAG: hypothetical protein A2W14_04490 [Candidatus Gottesmanbacteria bacterium RBG_16_37_8]
MVTNKEGPFNRDPTNSAYGLWKSKGPIPEQSIKHAGSLTNVAISEKIEELLEQGDITIEQVVDTRIQLWEERRDTRRGRRG